MPLISPLEVLYISDAIYRQQGYVSASETKSGNPHLMSVSNIQRIIDYYQTNLPIINITDRIRNAVHAHLTEIDEELTDQALLKIKHTQSIITTAPAPAYVPQLHRVKSNAWMRVMNKVLTALKEDTLIDVSTASFYSETGYAFSLFPTYVYKQRDRTICSDLAQSGPKYSIHKEIQIPTLLEIRSAYYSPTKTSWYTVGTNYDGQAWVLKLTDLYPLKEWMKDVERKPIYIKLLSPNSQVTVTRISSINPSQYFDENLELPSLVVTKYEIE